MSFTNKCWNGVARSHPDVLLGGIGEEYPLLILAYDPLQKAPSPQQGEVLSTDLDSLGFLQGGQLMRDLY